MQKKSLLVALFCGALCLTGCLKNEESASVVQVRNAKANELNSIATLNEAKAAAEAVYAEAELTLAKAEAKLKEAQAALILAQAETEKVRAELLKVQVKLQEVKVDEEKVALKKMEAELEILLAQAEAAKAQAEAAKQYWVNELENLLAKAQVDALENAQAIIEAEASLENYVLTLEGAQADSAQVYAKKYTTALDKVQKLQAQEIQIKAVKALVEAGAMTVKKAIYYQIDQIDAKIADNDAAIAYLKKYQTMTPDQAKAALNEARAELNEAYNNLKEKTGTLTKANSNKQTLDNKTADFFQNENDWYTKFQKDIQALYQNTTGYFGLITPAKVANWYTSRSIPVDVKVGDATVTVKASGLIIPDEEGGATQLPLWSYADETNKVVERYPNIDVYSDATKDFVTLTTTYIAPATLYYDNIQKALDYAVTVKEKASADAIALEKKNNAKEIQDEQDKIDFIKDSLELSKDYIAAREATVKAAEKAYKDALKESETKKKDILDAWQAFQKHMLTKHHDVDRDRFEDLFNADTTLIGLAKDTVAKKTDLETKKAMMEGETGLKAQVKAAFEAYAKAEGALRVAHDSLFDPTTEAGKAMAAVDAAAKLWNPKFAAAEGNAKYAISNNPDTTWYKGTSLNAARNAGTYVDKTIGKAQWAALCADLDYQTAKENSYRAQIDYWRGVITESELNTIKGKETTAKNASTIASDKETEAQTAYNNRVKELNTALGLGEGKLEDLFAAFNPEFADGKFDVGEDHRFGVKNIFNYGGFQFPTVAEPNANYSLGSWINKDKNKGWVDGHRAPVEVAGTAQAALFDAVKAAQDQQRAISQAQSAFDDAKTLATTAENNLKYYQRRLVAEFENIPLAFVDTITAERFADYMDDDAQALYKKYTDAKEKKVADEDEAWYALNNVAYGLYFDQVATHIDADRNHNPREFGWLVSSYNVDYKAKYIDKDGKEKSIAEKLHGILPSKVDPNRDSLDVDGNPVPNYTFSLQYKVEEAQEMIKTVLPKKLAEFEKKQANEVNTFKNDMANIMTAVNEKKTHETSYKAWIADRMKAEQDVNEAAKAKFDAEKEYNDAMSSYTAMEIVANSGMWVYDPNNDFKKTGDERDGQYSWITINEEIQKLEGEAGDLYDCVEALYKVANSEIEKATRGRGDAQNIDAAEFQRIIEKLEKATAKNVDSNYELKAVKNLLQETLKSGKVALQYILDMFDQEIEELDEQIDIWTAIANKYKAVMAAYLDIAEEAVVEEEDGETGPLDGEEEE